MKIIKKHNINAIIFFFLFAVNPSYAMEINELLHLFSQEKQSTVDFIEEKHASFLESPIISSGYIIYTSPNKLQKFILKPDKSSQIITENVLEIITEEEIQRINLEDYPEFSIIPRATINVLSGNYFSLKKDFEIFFEDSKEKWKLHLTPKNSYVLGYVNSIEILGFKNKILKITIAEPNDDQSITYLSNHR